MIKSNIICDSFNALWVSQQTSQFNPLMLDNFTLRALIFDYIGTRPVNLGRIHDTKKEIIAVFGNYIS